MKLSFLGVVPACALLLGCPKKPGEDGVIVLAMQAFDSEPPPPQPNEPDTDGLIVLAMVAFDADPPPVSDAGPAPNDATAKPKPKQ
jgi:hypothetical protein